MSEGVGVNEGMAAAVRVPAAMTVCAINVLTAPGLTVGTDGVASVGTHAMINTSAVTQTNNFDLLVAVIFSSSTSEPDQDTDSRLFFDDDGRIGKAQTAFYTERHDIGAFFTRGHGVKAYCSRRARFQFRKFNQCSSGQLRSVVIFEIQSRLHCPGAGVDNCPFDIKAIIGSEDGIIAG